MPIRPLSWISQDKFCAGLLFGIFALNWKRGESHSTCFKNRLNICKTWFHICLYAFGLPCSDLRAKVVLLLSLSIFTRHSLWSLPIPRCNICIGLYLSMAKVSTPEWITAIGSEWSTGSTESMDNIWSLLLASYREYSKSYGRWTLQDHFIWLEIWKQLQ